MNDIAIIFGSNGQDGFYLTDLLKEQGIKIIGVARSNSEYIGDVGDKGFVEKIIKKYLPSYIFHLAAVSNTQHKFIFEHQHTICNGVLYILETVKQYSPNSKVFISGSALQFKNNNLPINEFDSFEANDYYSVCRIHSAYTARYYRSLDIKVYIGYFFNHDSPLRSENHISKKIVTALMDIQKGKNVKVEIADVNIQKEWGFAGDIVQAIWTLVKQDKVFEAVIGTGKAYAISDWLTICFESKNLDWNKYVVKNEGFIPQYKVLVSDPSTIHSLGWQQETSIQQLASMMINFEDNAR